MKKPVVLFVTILMLSAGVIVYSHVFIMHQIGEAALREETVSGDRRAANGLTVGFQADAGADLHWINSFDYSSGKAESVFQRGEMLEAAEPSIYDDIRRDKKFGKGDLTKTVKTSLYEDIRFTGWDVEPFVTKLGYGDLEGLQNKEIHGFYDEIQQRVKATGRLEEGEILLGDYLDYYPISFHFQLGTKRYDSGSALTGLKIYDEQGCLSPEHAAVYSEDVALYTAMNDLFKIPVIDNEYQQYKISKEKEHDPETALGYMTEVKKPSGAGKDFYEFDPIMVLQEGRDENRMLFIVNNRTAKGAAVDVSQISGGYGVYELPIAVETTTVKVGPRVVSVPELIPLPDKMAMVYPLDETAEYVEMSLSGDQRYLAIFSVKDGAWFAELIDADTWAGSAGAWPLDQSAPRTTDRSEAWTADQSASQMSVGPMELFPASETMTYAWGEDGSLAVTNHQGDIAILSGTENAAAPYEVLYRGNVGKELIKSFFDEEMVFKKNSYAKYQYGIDGGLVVTVKDGKAALVQNLLVGNPTPGHQNTKTGDLTSGGRDPQTDHQTMHLRNAALECAVIDETGVLYRGRLKSDLVDLDYDIDQARLRAIGDFLVGGTNRKISSEAAAQIILPVSSKNQASWTMSNGY